MKKSGLIVLITLSVFTAIYAQTAAKKETIVYACGACGGSCDNLQFDKPGTCPHCAMALEKMTLTAFQKRLHAKPISVCFYLQDGIEVLDFAGPLEVFRVAGFNVFTVSKTKEKIKAQGVLTIIPEYSIKDAPPADVLVVFGGNTGPTTNDPAVISWVQSREKTSAYFLSVCTGAFIFGKAGLLDNLTATTYHLQIGALQKALPHTKVLPNTRFVDNGTIITTAGISAGIDGALHLVQKLRGLDYAKGVAKTIEYDKWVPNNGLVIAKNR